jgi:hypothetical protein
MIIIDEILISSELNSQFFACDIAKCKGACCVEGDVGAPLEIEEKAILKEIFPKVAPYLRPEGLKAIREQGVFVKDFTGDFSTPLVEGKECAYVVFEKGIALCGIEKAWAEEKIEFRKPISCHLYPVRVHKSKSFETINYDRWHICNPACSRGAESGVRVYEFVKDALIRKYGESFYKALDTEAKKEVREKGSSLP